MPKKSTGRGSLRTSKKTDNNTLIVCVLVVVLIAIAIFYLVRNNRIVKEGFESEPMELNNLTEKPNPKGADVVIVLFYVDWCPHCVSTKPEWNKLVNKMNNQKVNGNNVNVVACNAEGSTAEKEFANENNIEGYPTIKLVKENDVVDYNGARNVEALEEFIKENAN
jgi:thiol-disulfide isomerase/thioredoxin